MLVRVRMDLAFDLKKEAQAKALKESIVPFIKYAKTINEGKSNEEEGFIKVENCRHEDGAPCEILAKWTTKEGRVI